MQIKPIDRTIIALLESGYYRIPRFQRPYSWDRTNVEDFWNDAVATKEEDYFIGSFVVYPETPKSETLMVVDGQQRLTTITLTLAAIRNMFRSLGLIDHAKGIQGRIERHDINNRSKFILQTETSYPFFQDVIQNGDEDTHFEYDKLGSEQVALQKAFEFLSDKVLSVVTSVDVDSSVHKDQKHAVKVAKLEQIRDRLLSLQLILVQLPNETDAYLIFETLNTRGKDLGVSDLLKNHFARILRPGNTDLDPVKDKWNDLRSMIEGAVTGVDLNRFIYHSWLSRNPYTGQPKLFREIKDRVKTKTEARRLLDNLLEDARAYRKILSPKSYQWNKDERSVEFSIRTLNQFRVLQSVPWTLAVIRDLDKRELTIKQASKSLRALEKFHAQFTGVTSRPTGGGTARMYASSAEALANATGKNPKNAVLIEFRNKLKERVPEYEEFEGGIFEIYFTEEYSKSRPLVKYLLRKVDEVLRGESLIDYEKVSIEHLIPQSAIVDGADDKLVDAIGQLGNLILVSEKLNGKLGDRPAETKLKMLHEARVAMDQVLSSADLWSVDHVSERTRALARLLYDKALVV